MSYIKISRKQARRIVDAWISFWTMLTGAGVIEANECFAIVSLICLALGQSASIIITNKKDN